MGGQRDRGAQVEGVGDLDRLGLGGSAEREREQSREPSHGRRERHGMGFSEAGDSQRRARRYS